MKTLHEKLRSLLCDPEGAPAIQGSDADRALLAQYLEEVRALEAGHERERTLVDSLLWFVKWHGEKLVEEQKLSERRLAMLSKEAEGRAKADKELAELKQAKTAALELSDPLYLQANGGPIVKVVGATWRHRNGGVVPCFAVEHSFGMIGFWPISDWPSYTAHKNPA